jgi:hypothetical protein
MFMGELRDFDAYKIMLNDIETKKKDDLLKTFDLYYDFLKKVNQDYKKKGDIKGFIIKKRFLSKKLYLDDSLKMNVLKLVSKLLNKINLIKQKQMSEKLEEFYDEFERLLINLESSIRNNLEVFEILKILDSLKQFIHHDNFKVFLN